MKRFLLPLAALFLAGCGTTLYNPKTGQRLAVMRSDLTGVKYVGGGVKFSAETMDNSTPTGTALAGTKALADDVVTLGVGVGATGGTGSVNKLLPIAASIVPHVSLPKATPIPLSMRRPLF